MAYPEYQVQRVIELSPGRSAREILIVLKKEFPDDELPNERTIRRWRKHRSVDDPENGVQTGLNSSENWSEHNERLAGVVDTLLGHELKRVKKRVNPMGQVEYLLYDEIGANLLKRLTEDDLADKLVENTNLTYRQYEEWFFKTCFLPHLFAEWSDELKTKGFYVLAETQSYELIETLRLLAERKKFNGSCPVCKNWK